MRPELPAVRPVPPRAFTEPVPLIEFATRRIAPPLPPPDTAPQNPMAPALPPLALIVPVTTICVELAIRIAPPPAPPPVDEAPPPPDPPTRGIRNWFPL